MDDGSPDPGYLWVRAEPWESLFVLTIGGELDTLTAAQFSRQALSALAKN